MEVRLISAQLADTRLTLGCAELGNFLLMGGGGDKLLFAISKPLF